MLTVIIYYPDGPGWTTREKMDKYCSDVHQFLKPLQSNVVVGAAPLAGYVSTARVHIPVLILPDDKISMGEKELREKVVEALVEAYRGEEHPFPIRGAGLDFKIRVLAEKSLVPT